MSQPLNIGVFRNGKIVFSVFYRWHGFTRSAASEIKSLYDNVLCDAPASDDELQLNAIKYYQNQSLINKFKSSPKFNNGVAEKSTYENSDATDKFSESINALLTAHGGISSEDYEYAVKKFNVEFQTATGQGIVSISPDSVKQDKDYGFNVFIDIDNAKIDFGILVILPKNDKKYLLDYLGDDYDSVMKNAPTVPFNLDRCHFKDIEEWYTIINNDAMFDAGHCQNEEFLYGLID